MATVLTWFVAVTTVGQAMTSQSRGGPVSGLTATLITDNKEISEIAVIVLMAVTALRILRAIYLVPRSCSRGQFSMQL
jgi:hypothetical protein